MTRKTSECYKAVFNLIEEKILKLQPNVIMTDYEDGMRLAIRSHWSNVNLRGCWSVSIINNFDSITIIKKLIINIGSIFAVPFTRDVGSTVYRNF